ncbi:aldehyde dehydrogenase [Pseudonocardia sp. ICBG1034]|uniref:aldehyde dehydrogenase n=1 Tax=Pseudonocardia sp. ICBG1034 TaxID=2844381 RepID=UPI001CC9FCC0|nr:aldehyde dehydrogenase [Pseudonocardia sp. ICBG1034]
MGADRETFFIDGTWTAPASDRRFDVLDATTGESIAFVPEAGEVDVDRAVHAARRAFEAGWGTSTGAERAAALMRFADALEKRGTELATSVTRQNGMPIGLARSLEAGFGVGFLRFYADQAARLDEPDVRPSQLGSQTLVERFPMGVVAAIVPWNYPVVLALSKIAPALAAGCTVVVKPSPNTVLDSYVVAEAAEEAGLPPGVVNWVAADREVGAYLVSHPDVDKVAFTGSTMAGRAIGGVCATLLRPVTLELGGKSAAILLDDVDLDAVWPGLQFITMMNNGQTCVACSRVLVPASRYDELVDGVVDRLRGLSVGDPMNENTQIGPLATELHRDKVESYIARGRAEGNLLLGGGRPADVPPGWFVEPTAIEVDNSATIAQEEIFGPVLSVIRYDGDDDAVRLANDSVYGLGGAVFGSDIERAKAVARRVETGTIGINGYPVALGSPFGGVKESGIGREFSAETLGSYLNLKSIYVS